MARALRSASSFNTVIVECGDDIVVGGDRSTNHMFGDGSYHEKDPIVSGDDLMLGGDFSTNYMNGDASPEAGGSGGDDLMHGGARSENYLYGETETIGGEAGGYTCGDDVIFGGWASSNILHGDAGTLSPPFGSITAGDDHLIGGARGTNTMYGDSMNAADTDGEFTSVACGDDRLVSGRRSDDAMWGDVELTSEGVTGGLDTFVFYARNGIDTIHDFEQGKDMIELRCFGRISEFDDLKIAVEGGNSVIYTGGENAITVAGVDTLTEDDFAFYDSIAPDDFL